MEWSFNTELYVYSMGTKCVVGNKDLDDVFIKVKIGKVQL